MGMAELSEKELRVIRAACRELYVYVVAKNFLCPLLAWTPMGRAEWRGYGA